MVRKARIHPVAACGVERTTVLVLGGGPAGLAAAAELSLHGVGCVVIEPRAEVSHRRPRAKTTSIRTMEHLRRWGVADALREGAPQPVCHAHEHPVLGPPPPLGCRLRAAPVLAAAGRLLPAFHLLLVPGLRQ